MNLIVILVVCFLFSCILQDIHGKHLRKKKSGKKPKLRKGHKEKLIEKLEEDVGPVEWNPITNAVNMRWRIIQLGRAMVDDTAHKMFKYNETRAAYEKTPYYEIGYVFSEIVERYRKLVELVRRSQVARDDMFRTVSNLETAQSIYFELFHFVNMLHEIPRKYFENPKYQNLVVKLEGLYMTEDLLEDEEKKTLEFHKKINKMLKDIREKRLAMMNKKQKKYEEGKELIKAINKAAEEMKKRKLDRKKKLQIDKKYLQGSTRPRRPPKNSSWWPYHTYGWEPYDSYTFTNTTSGFY